MKRVLFTLALLVSAIAITAQNIDFPATEYTQDPKANFRLFKTENMYTFIKLDTRTGQMEIVQWSVSGGRGTYILSNEKRVYSAEDEIPGRFTLYATTNFYNFVLLDQIDGRVWQVQWHFDSDKRLVQRIYFNYEYEPKEEQPKPRIVPNTVAPIETKDLTPIDDEYKKIITTQMVSIQKQYKELGIAKSTINTAYMIAVRELMLSKLLVDWQAVERLNNILECLIQTDCTIDKAKLESELEGLTLYEDVMKVFLKISDNLLPQ